MNGKEGVGSEVVGRQLERDIEVSVSSSSVVRPLLLVEVLRKSLEVASDGARPQIRFQLDRAEELVRLLKCSHVFDILYVTAELGIVWKGRLHRIIKQNKGTIYKTTDELVGHGILRGMSRNHRDAKHQLHVEKLRNPQFHPQSVSCVYAISEEYLDVVGDLLDHASMQYEINKQVKKRAQHELSDLAARRKQAAQMRLEQEDHNERRLEMLQQRARGGYHEGGTYVSVTPLSELERAELQQLQQKHRSNE